MGPIEELNLNLFTKCMGPIEKCLRDAKINRRQSITNTVKLREKERERKKQNQD